MAFDSEDQTPRFTDEQLEIARQRSEQFVEVARKLGLYVQFTDFSTLTPNGRPGETLSIVGTCSFNKVIFQDRVQDPEQAVINDQFEKMRRESEMAERKAQADRVRRNLEAGRDPLDDGQ